MPLIGQTSPHQGFGSYLPVNGQHPCWRTLDPADLTGWEVKAEHECACLFPGTTRGWGLVSKLEDGRGQGPRWCGWGCSFPRNRVFSLP